MREAPRRRYQPPAFLIVALLGALSIGGCAGSSGASATSATSSTSAPLGSGAPLGAATPGEATLLAGMRLDLTGACQPLREGLPTGAIAAVECRSTDILVGGLQVFLFNEHVALLAAYLAVIEHQGIQLRTNLESLSIAEDSYQPGDDPAGPPAETRQAHWLDDTGHARYLATEPPFVLLAVQGTNGDVDGLYRWAWRGVADVPGAPNVWSEGRPADPSGKR